MNDALTSSTTSTADPMLQGGRCLQCEYVCIPKVDTCAVCMSQEIEPAAVSGVGTIYSATVVRAGPRDRQLPYGLAFVDLDAGLRVMAGYAVGDSNPLEPDNRVHVSQVGLSPSGLPLLTAETHEAATAS